MSDRYLRILLRQAQQGIVPLQDYVAAALRVSPPEVVIVDLQGFSVDDIRLAVRLVWIPTYVARDKHTKARVTLAGVLGDPIAKRVAPSRKKNDFPERAFFERNQSLLSDSEWRLFAADCAEHVLHYFEADYPNDKRPRTAIEASRRFARGEATVQELDDAWSAAWNAATFAESAARSAAGSAAGSAADSAAEFAMSAAAAAWSATWNAAWNAAESAARHAAWSAAESAAWSEGSAARNAEIAWQAARLSDYLLGLSALPPSVSNE